MTTLRFACCDERRRLAILGHPTLNGLEAIEVADLAPGELDTAEQADYATRTGLHAAEMLWQRRLTLHFINPLTPAQAAALNPEQILVEGGTRVRDIRVSPFVPPAGATTAVLRSSAAGDFSRYAVRLVRSPIDLRPPADFDPVLSSIDFSFKVDCPSDFDCRSGHVCLRQRAPEPVIDYLAKDYASFRRLILDRMALLAPDWRERGPADLGIALVETIAYAGDHLSYRQDAIATEAYLGTARRRTSLRRHARLVDYAMHDGCNARAWLVVDVTADTVLDPVAFRCFAGAPELPARIAPASPEEDAALGAGVEWFQILDPDPDSTKAPAGVPLFAALNELHFYTWGDDRCCLPAGSTGATLRGHHSELAVGQVLVLEQVKGPVTGDPADADPARRCAVRLTAVRSTDGAAPLVDPLDGTPITDIEWHAGDALRWPLCVTSRDADNAAIADISVARGNVVLVDHGQHVGPEGLGAAKALAHPPIAAGDEGCQDAAGACVTVTASPRTRFRPTLGSGPLTMMALVRVVETTASGRRVRWLPADPSASAAAALATSPSRTRPVLTLSSTLGVVVRRWAAAPDLLASAPSDLAVVAESESDGVVTLRFGDDEHGRCPEPGEAFLASYRTGNGRAGNVGPEAIAHAVSADARIAGVRNPLAAAGGVEPETIAEVRRRAPEAFRSQRRAVTPADYEALLGRRPEVQRAAARLRWTGSWHTHFVAVDQVAAQPLDEQREAELREYVEPFRLAGHDVEFDDPMYVSLEVGLEVCVADDYFRADVRARLTEVLSNRRLADGSLGLFHPDRLTFGQTIYASPILAAARTVDGVASARLTGFGRQGGDLRAALDPGLIRLARTEIARLENDPDWPEHGLLRLELLGGK